MGGEVRGMRGTRVGSFETPAWAEWPPMRFLPREKSRRMAVVERWACLLLDWASSVGEVVISVRELLKTRPFDVEPRLLEAVLEHLVATGRARWRSDGVAVLYWRSIEEWAKEIDGWLRANYIEVFSFHDLTSAGEAFSRLPVDELRKCIMVLEKAGLVKRVRKMKDYYQVVLPGAS